MTVGGTIDSNRSCTRLVAVVLIVTTLTFPFKICIIMLTCPTVLGVMSSTMMVIIPFGMILRWEFGGSIVRTVGRVIGTGIVIGIVARAKSSS